MLCLYVYATGGLNDVVAFIVCLQRIVFYTKSTRCVQLGLHSTQMFSFFFHVILPVVCGVAKPRKCSLSNYYITVKGIFCQIIGIVVPWAVTLNNLKSTRKWHF